MQNYGEHKYRANCVFGSFGNFLFVSIFLKDFLVFILFASHEVQTTIEIGIKRTHYPQPRGWESQRVAYEPLHFK